MGAGHSPEPREVELKLAFEPEHLDRVKAHPIFKTSAGEAIQLEAVYFDTEDQALRQGGVTFRVRREGNRYVQTVKAGRAATGVALDRGEWERQLPSADPDFDALSATPLARYSGDDEERRKLRPIFTIGVERFQLARRGRRAEIELAVDAGRIAAGGKEASFAEIEIELKAGDRKHLFRLALELAGALPVRLSFTTKSDRGYALLERKPARSVKAERINLEAGQSAGQAFRTIAASCLRQLVANEAIVRERPNPDAIHQARVAIRRLRAAISLFGKVAAGKQTGSVKAKLKWMAAGLGGARDLDVFLARLGEKGHALSGPAAGLTAEIVNRREAAYREAVDQVASDRFALAVIEVAAWIEAGEWLTGKPAAGSALHDRPIEIHAHVEFDRRWRKVRGRLGELQGMDDESRHQLRIEIKKLRYAAEFFRPLFETSVGRKRVRTALRTIRDLQETLGNLNDLAVARTVIHTDGSPVDWLDPKSEAELSAAMFRQARAFRKLEPF